MKPGRALHKAAYGKKIDIDSEEAKAYARERSIDLTAPEKRVPDGRERQRASRGSVPVEQEVPLSDEDVGPFVDMTLRELLEKFGTGVRFKEWMQGRKHITDIKTKELALMARAGQLVDRNLMVVGVFEPFDSAFRRLLTDASKAIATQAVAKVKAGATEEEIEELARDILGSQIRPAKQRAIKTLEAIAAMEPEAVA